MIFYGIDPGFTGAIAVYAPNTGFFDVFDMPTMLNSKGKVELNHFAVLNILEKEMEVEHQAWIEKVGAMPGQGVSSMFRFGQVFGALEMAIAASGCVTRYVSPVTWKRHYTITSNKDVARSTAMQRFPEHAEKFALKKHDGRAEAALIALYGSEHKR